MFNRNCKISVEKAHIEKFPNQLSVRIFINKQCANSVMRKSITRSVL